MEASFNLVDYVISCWPCLIHPSMSVRNVRKGPNPYGVVSIPFMGCVGKGIDTSPQLRVVVLYLLSLTKLTKLCENYLLKRIQY